MYKEMIKDAIERGMTSESKMWENVDAVDELLEVIQKEHPDMYWAFIRKMHGSLHKGHYNQKFAIYDVEQMKPLGMYWTKAQIDEATKGMVFAQGVTEWDRYVAFNAFANDLKPEMADDQILKAAYKFWFADKDWNNNTKIWDYMCMARK